MRAVIQRVASASVKTADGLAGEIGAGLLVFLGVAKNDTPADCTWLAEKILSLRVFPDDTGQMNRAVNDLNGDLLVVSQFTLHANVRKGTRPSFNDAAKPELAGPLYEEFILQLQTALGRPVQTGKFGAAMKVTLVNDGPVTIIVDTKDRD
ncbi:MAG TPA: D-aminoacyl-tRNA deacylase [Opitutaceae bacterium]|jgi:D-tyrosyl-tRNA(Tyr) deacylase|nr:D-aminoacyl-tRNA deacylase [Opitutaceae bacterium]